MFGSKSKKAEVYSAEVDEMVKTFTTMVNNLNQKAEEAIVTKNAIEEEIVLKQKECDNLKAVSERASGLAAKIATIFG